MIVSSVASTSAQNFNDSENISAWNISTQEGITPIRNISPTQELDMWNIQVAIELAANEESDIPEETITEPIQQTQTSSGSGSGSRGGRLGTANYSLRNRSELVTITKNIAKAEQEYYDTQHASAQKEEVKIDAIATESVSEEQILEEQTKKNTPIKSVPEIDIVQIDMMQTKNDIPSKTIEEVISTPISQEKQIITRIPTESNNTAENEDSVKNISREKITSEKESPLQAIALINTDNEIIAHKTKEIEKQFPVYKVVFYTKTILIITIICVSVIILLQNDVILRKKMKHFLSVLSVRKNKK